MKRDLEIKVIRLLEFCVAHGLDVKHRDERFTEAQDPADPYKTATLILNWAVQHATEKKGKRPFRALHDGFPPRKKVEEALAFIVKEPHKLQLPSEVRRAFDAKSSPSTVLRPWLDYIFGADTGTPAPSPPAGFQSASDLLARVHEHRERRQRRSARAEPPAELGQEAEPPASASTLPPPEYIPSGRKLLAFESIESLCLVDPLPCATHFQDRRELHEISRLLETKHQGLLAICGVGGSGKTTLAQHLQGLVQLEMFDPPEVRSRFAVSKLFVFTFYRSGNTVAKLNQELARWLTGAGADVDIVGLVKRAGTESLARRKKLLLVLDGLEVVQQRTDGDAAVGDISGKGDGWLRRLLDDAAQGLPGVVIIITSRLDLADVVHEAGSHHSVTIDGLDSSTALALLRSLGVRGADAELSEIVKRFAGHALSVSMLGRFIAHFHGGSVTAFQAWEQQLPGSWLDHVRELPADNMSPKPLRQIVRDFGRFGRIAGFYGHQFQHSDPATLDILRCIAVSPVPLEAKRFAAVFTGVGAEGLAGRELAALSEAQVEARLQRLVELGLVFAGAESAYTMHPAILEAMRGILTDERGRGIERALLGQLHVELENRASDAVFDAKRIEAIKAIVLRLLETDAETSAVLDPGKTVLDTAWRWLTDSPPHGLGGWSEVVWGRYPVNGAVAAICEALESKYEDPATPDEHVLVRLRMWSAALCQLGQVQRAEQLVERMREKAQDAGDQERAGAYSELRAVAHVRGHAKKALLAARDELALLSLAWSWRSRASSIWLHVAYDELVSGERASALESCAKAVHAVCNGHRELLAFNDIDLRFANCVIELGAPREGLELARYAIRAMQPRDLVEQTSLAVGREIEGQALLRLGHADRAVEAFADALRIYLGKHSIDALDALMQRCRAKLCQLAQQARDGKATHATASLESLRLDLLGVVREARRCGLGRLHNRALLTLAEIDLVLGEHRSALHAAETAVYGQLQRTGAPLYEAAALDETTAIVVHLDPAAPARADARGIFPPPGSPWPELLALSHSFSGDKPELARGHLIIAKALLLLAEHATPGAGDHEAQRARARHQLEAALAIHEMYATGRDGDRTPAASQAERVLADLARGVSSHNDMTWPAVADPAPLAAPFELHAVAGRTAERRYRCSISYEHSQAALAYEVAHGLGQRFGRDRVFYEAFHPHVAAEPCADLLRLKRYVYDSTLIVIFEQQLSEATHYNGLESWTGLKTSTVLAAAPWADNRIVIIGRDHILLTQEDGPGAEVHRLRDAYAAPSIVDRIAALHAKIDAEDRYERVYYLKVTPKDGRLASYFVAIEPAKEDAFNDALKGTQKFNLEHFGTILRSRYGEPTLNMKKRMMGRYGIKYDDGIPDSPAFVPARRTRRGKR